MTFSPCVWRLRCQDVAPELETLLTSTIEVVSELLFFGQRVEAT